MPDLAIVIYAFGTLGWWTGSMYYETRRAWLRHMWLTPVWPLVLLWWFVLKMYSLWIEAWGKEQE